jgi:hypothetical protein
MQKERIISFINRYYLAGSSDSVKLSIKDKQLQCSFISADRNVIGNIGLENVDIEDSELGVYNTGQLLKMLSVLDSDIQIKVVKSEDKAFLLHLLDTNTSITYILSDLSVIEPAPKIKKLPDFNCTISITKEFSEKFLKAKAGMPEADNFAVTSNDSGTEIVLNYSTVNTNRIKFQVTANTSASLKATCFSSNIFKEILSANKNAESGIFEVSDQGLAKVTFAGKDFSSVYYLVQLSTQ